MAGTITFPTGSITTPSGDPGTLPAATVPLVGTELMEIYEGGAWKYLTTANFTAGRVVPTGGVLVTGPDIPENGIYLSDTDTVGIATNGVLRVWVSTTALSSGLNTIIGSTSVAPDTTLHVHTGSAGAVTAFAAGLTVENSANAAVNILVPDGNVGYLAFGNPTSNLGAVASWDFTNSLFTIGPIKTGGSLVLLGGGGATNMTLSGGAGAELTTIVRNVVMTNGNLTLSAGDLIITTPTTPASASATGTVGTIAWDTGFIYVCTATDTWERVAIATW